MSHAPPRNVPLWLRFWPQAVLAFGVGLMFGSAFTGLWWPGVTITLIGVCLSGASLFASKPTATSTVPEDERPHP